MKAFVTTDRDTIVDSLQGENLLNIISDELGNTMLVFEGECAHTGDLLTIKPTGEISATIFCNEEEALAEDNQPARKADEAAPSVTTLTAAAREYINNMTEDELIEHGHNEFNGKDQMIAALHTIDLLAAHDEEEARAAYFDFLENNLSGMNFEIQG